MDIGKMYNNDEFYEGYESEPEVVLTILNQPDVSLHIWEGYFHDIFGNPIVDGAGWNGFTYDYNEFKGAFEEDEACVIANVQDYLNDLNQYDTAIFCYEESRDVACLLKEFLMYALSQRTAFLMEVR